MGTGLSFALELWELDRGFSPFVEEELSLLDRRFLRSLGMSEEVDETGTDSAPSGDDAEVGSVRHPTVKATDYLSIASEL